MNGKYLITTDYYFFGPDGCRYRAAWGEVEILEDTFLGIKTNRNATNWYLKVGNKDKFIIIAGCQIHYAIRCEDKPKIEFIDEYMEVADGSDNKEMKGQVKIYLAE